MNNQQIRVLLADDHSMVRKGLSMILATDPKMITVGEAGDGEESVRLAQQLKPDVVVMDVSMPKLNGIDSTRQICECCPSIKVLVLSMHRDPVYVREVLRAGAKGYLIKSDPDENLLEAVRAVARGDAYLSSSVAGTVLSDYKKHVTNPVDLLSNREREVLQMIAEGQTNKDVARNLNLSVYTVEAHRSRIMEKLNLHSTGDLVRFAIRNGIIL